MRWRWVKIGKRREWDRAMCGVMFMKFSIRWGLVLWVEGRRGLEWEGWRLVVSFPPTFNLISKPFEETQMLTAIQVEFHTSQEDSAGPATMSKTTRWSLLTAPSSTHPSLQTQISTGPCAGAQERISDSSHASTLWPLSKDFFGAEARSIPWRTTTLSLMHSQISLWMLPQMILRICI